jgi:hypothetical protein
MRNKSSYGLIMIMLFVVIAGIMGVNATNPVTNSPNNFMDNNNTALVADSNSTVSNNINTLKNSKNITRSHEKLKNNSLAEEIANLKP